jgi:hypothetical protein
MPETTRSKPQWLVDLEAKLAAKSQSKQSWRNRQKERDLKRRDDEKFPVGDRTRRGQW